MNIIQFTLKGFILLNRNLKLYGIAVLFNLAPFPFIWSAEHLDSWMSIFLLLIYLVLAVFNMSYHLSVPIFLQQTQKEENIKISSIFLVIKQNVRRIIFPSLLLFLMLMVIMLVYLIAVLVMKLDVKQFTRPFGWFQFFTALFAYLFMSTPLFYSLEKKSLLRSIGRSIVFGVKNITSLFVFVLALYITNSLYMFIPVGQMWGQVAYTIVSTYLYLGLLSALMFYYQDKKVKNK